MSSIRFEKNDRKLTWKEFARMLMVLAVPIAIQNLLTTTASMVDTIMIGSEGELAVAAVGVCSQISSLLFNMYWGFVSCSLLFMSQYWGAKDADGMNRAFGLTVISAGVFGLAFGAINVISPGWILGIYTDKTAIIELAKPYMRIVGFAYPMQVMAVVVTALLKSTERVKVPLICSIISLLTNFCINYILIYGRFGAPKMGVAGAAIGTLVSGIVNIVLLVLYLVKTRGEIHFSVRKAFDIDRGFVKSYASKAFPIVCNEILCGVGQMLINVVMGHQSDSAIAAMAAFRVCEGFVYAFFGGLSNASSVAVGNEVGAGNLDRGLSYAKRSALVCPLITFTIVLIMFVLNRPLLGLFSLGSQAMLYGKYMLLIYMFFGAVRTCCYIQNECFRAGGEAVVGTVLEVCGLMFFSVPATWIAGMVLHLPFLFVFAFVYTDELLRFVILTPYLIKGRWIKPMTGPGREALSDFRSAHGIKKK